MAKAEIVKLEEHCLLVVRDKHQNEVAVAKFDRRHIPKVAPLYWSLGSGGYPRNIKYRKNLHQIIMGEPPPGKEVDHINGDRLDNRDDNLRFVTHAENGRNLKLSKRNKSGYRGVWRDEVNAAWQVKLCYQGKQIFLGRHKELTKAIEVRQAAEQEYYGEYARAA